MLSTLVMCLLCFKECEEVVNTRDESQRRTYRVHPISFTFRSRGQTKFKYSYFFIFFEVSFKDKTVMELKRSNPNNTITQECDGYS